MMGITARFSFALILLYVLLRLSSLDRWWCKERTSINLEIGLLAHKIFDLRRILSILRFVVWRKLYDLCFIHGVPARGMQI